MSLLRKSRTAKLRRTMISEFEKKRSGFIANCAAAVEKDWQVMIRKLALAYGVCCCALFKMFYIRV
jgi:hypothetical protein